MSLGLQGSFCMHLIQTPIGPEGDWVPILAYLDIVEKYSENVFENTYIAQEGLIYLP